MPSKVRYQVNVIRQKTGRLVQSKSYLSSDTKELRKLVKSDFPPREYPKSKFIFDVKFVL